MIYKIEILNWEKHNGQLKKGHTHFMVSKRFFDDAKIASLNSEEAWMFLRCLALAADTTSSCFEVERHTLARRHRVRPQTIDSCLTRLESFQLLTYEKIEAPYINRIEEKRKEKKRIPVGLRDATRAPSASSPAVDQNQNTNLAIARYCDNWKNRYKSDRSPPILGQHAANLKKIILDIGLDRVLVLIDAYFQMPDQWFLKKRHDIPTFAQNLNAITQFSETGQIITNQKLKQMDSQLSVELLKQQIVADFEKEKNS